MRLKQRNKKSLRLQRKKRNRVRSKLPESVKKNLELWRYLLEAKNVDIEQVKKLAGVFDFDVVLASLKSKGFIDQNDDIVSTPEVDTLVGDIVKNVGANDVEAAARKLKTKKGMGGVEFGDTPMGDQDRVPQPKPKRDRLSAFTSIEKAALLGAYANPKKPLDLVMPFVSSNIDPYYKALEKLQNSGFTDYNKKLGYSLTTNGKMAAQFLLKDLGIEPSDLRKNDAMEGLKALGIAKQKKSLELKIPETSGILETIRILVMEAYDTKYKDRVSLSSDEYNRIMRERYDFDLQVLGQYPVNYVNKLQDIFRNIQSSWVTLFDFKNPRIRHTSAKYIYDATSRFIKLQQEAKKKQQKSDVPTDFSKKEKALILAGMEGNTLTAQDMLLDLINVTENDYEEIVPQLYSAGYVTSDDIFEYELTDIGNKTAKAIMSELGAANFEDAIVALSGKKVEPPKEEKPITVQTPLDNNPGNKQRALDILQNLPWNEKVALLAAFGYPLHKQREGIAKKHAKISASDYKAGIKELVRKRLISFNDKERLIFPPGSPGGQLPVQLQKQLGYPKYIQIPLALKALASMKDASLVMPDALIKAGEEIAQSVQPTEPMVTEPIAVDPIDPTEPITTNIPKSGRLAGLNVEPLTWGERVYLLALANFPVVYMKNKEFRREQTKKLSGILDNEYNQAILGLKYKKYLTPKGSLTGKGKKALGELFGALGDHPFEPFVKLRNTRDESKISFGVFVRQLYEWREQRLMATIGELF